MKQYKITIENYKSLKLVELDLAPGIEGFVGENATGKTSVLDAISELVNGKNDPSKIKDSEEKYCIRLDVFENNLPVAQVSRIQTQAGSTLKAKGLPLGMTPVGFISQLFDEHMLNPIKIISDNPVAFLKQHLPVKLEPGDLPSDIDLPKDINLLTPFNALDVASKYIGVLRREKGKELQTFKTILEDMNKTLPELPKEETDITVIQKELEELKEQQTKNKMLTEEKERTKKSYVEKANLIKVWVDKITELTNQIEQLRTRIDTSKRDLDDLSARVKSIGDTKDLTLEIQAKQFEIDKHKQVETNKLQHKVFESKRLKMVEVEKEHLKLDNEFKRLTYELPKVLIKRANLPIEGLEFDGETLIVNGRRVDLLSETERAIIATQIATTFAKMKGHLAISLDGIEIMDPEHRKLWIEHAKNSGLKVFYTRQGKPEGEHERTLKDGLLQ
jgi:hypothetical protein